MVISGVTFSIYLNAVRARSIEVLMMENPCLESVRNSFRDYLTVEQAVVIVVEETNYWIMLGVPDYD